MKTPRLSNALIELQNTVEAFQDLRELLPIGERQSSLVSCLIERLDRDFVEFQQAYKALPGE